MAAKKKGMKTERYIYLGIIILLLISGGWLHLEGRKDLKKKASKVNTLEKEVDNYKIKVFELEQRLNKAPSNIVEHIPKPIYVYRDRPAKVIEKEFDWDKFRELMRIQRPDDEFWIPQDYVRQWWRDTVTHNQTTTITEMDITGVMHKIRYNFYDAPVISKKGTDWNLYASMGFNFQNTAIGVGCIIGVERHALSYRYYHSDNKIYRQHNLEYNLKL